MGARRAGSGDGANTGPDVVVVGAGIVGICSALHLQMAGARVTVIDCQAPGEGASFGNAAVIGEEHVMPVAMPQVLAQLPRMLADPMSPLAVRWSYLPTLFPWLLRFLKAARPSEVERISVALAALLDGAIDAFVPLLREAGAEDMLRRPGWLVLFHSRRGFDRYAATLRLQDRRGVRHEVISSEELRQLEPALGSGDALHKGVYYPDVGHTTDTHGLVQALARALRERGGQILREEVRDVEIGADGPERVVTDRGRHAFDRLVIAAGAWSRPLARRLGRDVPLDTERGYHLTLPRPNVTPRMPIVAQERATVCTPVEQGLRIAGTVELGGLDAPPDWRRADRLLDNARELFPRIDGGDASRWMGCRPSMPDSLPVISRAPNFHNTVFAFGHGHCGLMLGARTGEMVRDLTLDREPSIDLGPFRADRF